MLRKLVFLGIILPLFVSQGHSRGHQRTTCNVDKDCPAYHYCFYNVFTGSYCLNNPLDSVNCKAQNGDFPDHEVCLLHEKLFFRIHDDKEVVSRCFKTIDSKGNNIYRCGKSFINECTPDYNSGGHVIKENSCPFWFTCKEKEFLDGPKKVCLPDIYATEAGTTENCKSSFDCGYSTLLDQWVECYQGKCSNPIQ